MVEVAGVEPASYRVSIRSTTSLVSIVFFVDDVGTKPPHAETPLILGREFGDHADQPDLSGTEQPVSGEPAAKRLHYAVVYNCC